MTRFLTFWKKRQGAALAFVIPAMILFLAYAACGTSPFGDRSVLVLDLAGQYVYFFEALRDAILGGGSLIYSFSRSLGGEMLGILAYYLASPFSLLVLLFPKNRITAAILLMILLKCSSTGFTMHLYLSHRFDRIASPMRIMLSSAFALSGFAVTYQSNLMWLDALILLPLVVWGLERLIHRQGFLLYTVALSLTLITNYYMGYMIALFSALWFVATLCKGKAKSRRELFNNATIFALFSVLAALIAAVILFPAVYSLSFGKSDFTPPGQREFLLTPPWLLLQKLLPAAHDSVMDDGSPLLYCGIFVLLLLPLYVLSKDIPKRHKIVTVTLLCILLFSAMLEPLDRIWHGFSAPNGLPCRFAFLLVFVLLHTVATLCNTAITREVSHRSTHCIAITGIVLLTASSLLYAFSDALLIPRTFLTLSVIFIAVTALLLLLWIHTKQKRQLFSCLLVATCLIELGCNTIASFTALHEDVSFIAERDFRRLSDAHLAAAQNLPNGFYRAESTEHLKSNDNFSSGLQGVSGSTSTLHTTSLQLLSAIGIPARWHRSMYVSPNPITDSLLGMEYVLSSSQIPFYTPVFEEQGLTAWQNSQALSLAYGTQSIDPITFSVNTAQNCNLLLRHLTGLSEITPFSPLPESSVLHGGCDAYATDMGTQIYLPQNGEDTAFLTLQAIADREGDLFFTLPIPTPAPVYLYVNNTYMGVHFDTACSYMLYLGRYQAGETVSVRMVMADHDRPLNLYKGEPHFFYYDKVAANKALSILSATQLSINQNASDTHISGQLTTKTADQHILFTVPFDRNWQVYVDGKRIETRQALGALVSFQIEQPGEHSVVLRYFPKQLIIGAAISTASIALLVVLIQLDRKKQYFTDATAS